MTVLNATDFYEFSQIPEIPSENINGRLKKKKPNKGYRLHKPMVDFTSVFITRAAFQNSDRQQGGGGRSGGHMRE